SVLDASGAVEEDFVQEKGRAEFALQKKDANNNPLWFDASGNETTSNLTGLPVLLPSDAANGLPVYLDGLSRKVLVVTSRRSFVTDFENGELLYVDATGSKTTANTGAPSLLLVNRTRAVPFTRVVELRTSVVGTDRLDIDDSANTNG